jgi:hypothetical protein
MAQFKADIQGSRGSVSRLGGKTSGITGHIRGWESGIRIEGHHDEDLGDIFMIYQTSGSGFKAKDILIGKLISGSFQSMENT